MVFCKMGYDERDRYRTRVLNWKEITNGSHCLVCAALYTNLLNDHRRTQGVERVKLAKHREKCYKCPEKYLGICIDGMDQKKT